MGVIYPLMYKYLKRTSSIARRVIRINYGAARRQGGEIGFPACMEAQIHRMPGINFEVTVFLYSL